MNMQRLRSKEPSGPPSFVPGGRTRLLGASCPHHAGSVGKYVKIVNFAHHLWISLEPFCWSCFSPFHPELHEVWHVSLSSALPLLIFVNAGIHQQPYDLSMISETPRFQKWLLGPCFQQDLHGLGKATLARCLDRRSLIMQAPGC